jgi:8-oxo-dGTP diphosphatase
MRVVLPQLEQVTTSSGPDRDPRGWSASAPITRYYRATKSRRCDKTEAFERCNPKRLDTGWPLTIAIAGRGLAMLRDKVEGGALPPHLLAGKFTLTDLQSPCESSLGRELDKGALRRKSPTPTLAPVPREFPRGRAAADFEFY